MKIKHMRLTAYLIISIIFQAIVPSALAAKRSENAPTFPVKAFLLMNADTEEILYAKNANTPQAPASLVKIMTLYLVFEAIHNGKISLQQKYKTSEHISKIGGSEINLANGEIITVQELIKATAIRSANDAASALAEIVAGSQSAFVSMMNQKAKELDLDNTFFRSPNGLPYKNNPDHITASDIAKLAYLITKKYPEIFKYTSRRISHIRKDTYQLVNTNKLIGKYKGINGLKTGVTNAAGYCLVATARRGNLSLISVILGANSKDERFKYSARLLDYGFNHFKETNIKSKGKQLKIPVPNGKKQFIQSICSQDLHFTLHKKTEDRLRIEVYIPHSLIAPIMKGSKVAEYVATLDGKVIAKTDIIAQENLKKAGFLRRLFRRMFN